MENLVKNSILIKKGNPSIYLYPSINLTEEQNTKSINIIFFGENGSGKSTLLNSLANAIMRVKFEDPFRYKIIKEDIDKQNNQKIISNVQIYNILAKEGSNIPPIKIINMPDFGSSSFEEDEKIFEKIMYFFQNESDIKINFICFVVKSTKTKLSLREEYIYNRVLNLFGDNFKGHYLFMLTFCDGSKPRIRKYLESDKSLFKNFIPHTKEQYYYTFNFSSIFANKDNHSSFTEAFWTFTMNTFENFLNRIVLTNSISFTLTKELIEQNNKLAQSLKKIYKENENCLFDDSEEDNEILHRIFPFPQFDINNKPKEYKDNIIYIPTGRKIKNTEIDEKIPCFFMKNSSSKNILIIFHCNGLDMFDIFETVFDLDKKYNINILIPEYPGYSIYNSPLSSTICLKNTLIIYDFILNNIKNITEKNIFVAGRSLGTGPAIYLSSKRHPAGTFLISPYTTFASVGYLSKEDYHYEALSNHFRSIDYIERVNNPILFIHGKIDDLINYKDSEELYNKCRNDIIKNIIIIEEMNHNFSDEFLLTKIIPIINEFAEKNCPTYKIKNDKNENSIKIDFDKKFYN